MPVEVTHKKDTVESLIAALEVVYFEPEGTETPVEALRIEEYLRYKLKVIHLLARCAPTNHQLPETGPASVQETLSACARLENKIAQKPAGLPNDIDRLAVLLLRRHFAVGEDQQSALEILIAAYGVHEETQLPCLWYQDVKKFLESKNSPLASYMPASPALIHSSNKTN